MWYSVHSGIHQWFSTWWYLRQMFSKVVVSVKRLITTGLYRWSEVAVAQKVEQVGWWSIGWWFKSHFLLSTCQSVLGQDTESLIDPYEQVGVYSLILHGDTILVYMCIRVVYRGTRGVYRCTMGNQSPWLSQVRLPARSELSWSVPEQDIQPLTVPLASRWGQLG